MTKPGAALAAVGALLAFLALPPVDAHGAPDARSIDTRVLADDDGLLAFGGCIPEAGCQSEGIDLLALDVREAADPLGRPMLVLRFLYQTELATVAGTSLEATFTAGGSEETVTVLLADANATSPDAARVVGPAEVGDGHPKAVDAWLDAQALGLAAGDALGEIRVRSVAAAEDGADDLMPGTWSSGGQQVPFIPAEPSPGIPAEPAAGSYTLGGPAALVNATGPAAPVTLHHAAATATLTVRSATDLPQLANLTLVATGANATLSTTTLNLPDATVREATVTIHDAEPGATIEVLVATDLGGFARVPIPVVVQHHDEPEPSATTSSTTQESPILAPGVTIAVLALAALRRR